MILDSDTVLGQVLERFPGFQYRWNEHLQYWDGKSPSFGLALGELVDYTIDLIYARRTQEVERLLRFAEELLIAGDMEVQNAVAVSYLESLVNVASHHPELFEGFVPFLGDKSTEFIRAWDEFTGAKTPGLKLSVT